MKAGYTVDEWQQIADQQLSFLQRAVVYLAPFAGLTANAIAHLREDWIDWCDEYVSIEVPRRAPSNSFKLAGGGNTGHLGPLIPRDTPCKHCRKTSSIDGFEHMWTGNREVTGHYTTVLHRELAAPAVEVLEEVFITHRRPEFAATPTAIQGAARAVGEERTNDGEWTYPKFLRTGPVLYAKYGLSKRDIADLTRYTERVVREIVTATSGVNFGQISTLGLLKTLSTLEPATLARLTEELDITQSAIHQRLVRLQEEGRVSVEDNGHGPPAATWRTAKNWTAPFCCQQCGYETLSLMGIREHRRQAH